MKIGGECPGASGLLGKLFFMLFDTFQYDFLIMQKSALMAWEFCIGSSYV
jgi:hypothetical protein